MIKLLLPLFIFATSSAALADVKINWPEGKSAVAWHTVKKMFFLKTLEPVGINTEIQAEVVSTGDIRMIRVLIPVDKFDSGEPSRDKDVVKMLKGDVQPNLEFTSLEMSKAQFTDLTNGKLEAISGTLKIGGQEYPVDFSVSVAGTGQDQIIDGSIFTTYSHFDIKPPSVAGGLITKAKDELNLFFHIQAKDVKGL